MREVVQAGGIVINAKGQILVIKNNIGRQTFPKGSQELGETLIQTARREIKEETGLKNFEIGKELGVLSRPGYIAYKSQGQITTTPQLIKHIHLFLCTTTEMKLKPQADDAVMAKWVNPSDLEAELSWAEEFEFFKKHRAKLNL